VEVLEEMNLRQVVERSPKGLDAEVGESGVLLSGGERQRMAVARALLQRPRLLMLDESTSNLDGLNEESVYRSVARAASDCTVMVVAHRLATVRDCDQILVLSDGRVVGSGTHDELLDTSSLYRRLVRTQLDPRGSSAMRNGNGRTAGHAAVKVSGRSDSPGATTTG
jgi:ATP-binding cassette subfamily B protein